MRSGLQRAARLLQFISRSSTPLTCSVVRLYWKILIPHNPHLLRSGLQRAVRTTLRWGSMAQVTAYAALLLQVRGEF